MEIDKDFKKSLINLLKKEGYKVKKKNKWKGVRFVKCKSNINKYEGGKIYPIDVHLWLLSNQYNDGYVFGQMFEPSTKKEFLEQIRKESNNWDNVEFLECILDCDYKLGMVYKIDEKLLEFLRAISNLKRDFFKPSTKEAYEEQLNKNRLI